MDRDYVTWKLGAGNAANAARWLAISPAIYSQWPDVLSPIMVDRFLAALFRKELARALGVAGPTAFFADPRNETLLESIFEKVSVALVMAGMMPRVPPEYAARHERDRSRDDSPKPRNRPRASSESAASAPA